VVYNPWILILKPATTPFVGEHNQPFVSPSTS